MTSRQIYTRNTDTYYQGYALLIVYFKLFVIWIYVLVCYQSNMKIWVKSVNKNFTANAPLIHLSDKLDDGYFNWMNMHLGISLFYLMNRMIETLYIKYWRSMIMIKQKVICVWYSIAWKP